MMRKTTPLEAFFLVGPTAVGKTDVAHLLAERMGCRILSVDSMQVYTGMDIGTAKPSIEERKRFNYGGIDLSTPEKSFSVWDYREAAMAFLRKSDVLGCPVIAVGGSGLYVKSLTDGLQAVAPADERIRRHWQEMLKAADGLALLQQEAMKKDPAAYQTLPDRQNPRRLIRLIEKAGFEQGGGGSPGRPERQERAPLVGISMPAMDLSQRIEKRAGEMLACGLLEEAHALEERYGKLSPTAGQAIGYAEAFDVIAGKMTISSAVAEIARRTRQLAKRQMTWFRHQAEVKWLPAGNGVSAGQLADAVAAEWERYGPTAIE
ncbi:MAG: tRNA (adenosine(37)-N6)-dimethylallyltransferase MiaA [Verrucomicrobia bacterium]|nr:tRNA (adenosine(37)-N6)-dimethylallyltransferase MiaA [Verrucomicrobiota bacterium]